MSNFRVDQVHASKAAVDKETTWAAFEGRVFGPGSHYPLKMFIGTGAEKWTRGWQEGCDKFSRKLKSFKKEQRFAKQCSNPAIMPQAALAMANRRAIEVSGCLMKVAWCGPEFTNKAGLEAWVDGSVEYLLAGDQPCEVPADVIDLYVFDDGTWRVPISIEPPEEWLATNAQIKDLMTEDIFNDQVANQRRILHEDGGEDDSRGLKNSESGPSPKPRGTRSRKVSEKA